MLLTDVPPRNAGFEKPFDLSSKKLVLFVLQFGVAG